MIEAVASGGVGIYGISPDYLTQPARSGFLLAIRVCGKRTFAKVFGGCANCEAFAAVLNVITPTAGEYAESYRGLLRPV